MKFSFYSSTFLAVGVFAAFVCSTPAFSIPLQISYGARLTDNNGNPVSLSGGQGLRITFWDAQTNGNQKPGTGYDICADGSSCGASPPVSTFINLTLTNGAFQVMLVMSAANFHSVFPDTGTSNWIQVELVNYSGTSITGVVQTFARQQFAAIPYSLKVPVDGTSQSFNASGQLQVGSNGVLPLASGGTGVNAASNSALLTGIGGAASGANADITSLSGGSNWGINNTGTVFFNTGGNVGIGTTVPGQMLDVRGNIEILAGANIRPTADSATALQIVNAAGSNYVTFDSTNQRMVIGPPNCCGGGALQITTGYNTGTSPANASIYLGAGGPANSSQLVFGNGTGWKFHIGTVPSGPNPFSQLMTFTDGGVNGGVGIGSTGPTAKLDIQGTATGVTTLMRAKTSGGTTALLVDSGGNVGIGTASATTTLDVFGSGRFALNVGILTSPTSWNLQVGSGLGGSAHMAISGSGSGASGGSLLALLNGGTLIGAFGNSSVYFGGAFDSNMSVISANGLRFYSGNSLRMTVDILGNVGIGANTPSSKLHLFDTGNPNVPQSDIVLSRVWGGVGARSASSLFHYYTGGGYGSLVFGVTEVGDGVSPNTLAAAKMVIQNNGAVGIGTTSPGFLLDVEGVSAGVTNVQFGANLPVYLTSNIPAIAFNEYYSGGSWYYGKGSSSSYAGGIAFNPTTGNMQLAVTPVTGNANGVVAATTPQVTIQANGNFGIGTAAPTAKLDVTGGYLRALDNGTNVAPTSGMGVELFAGSGLGYVLSYDRSASVFHTLDLYGSAVTIHNMSDRRLKKEIRDLSTENGLDAILKLRPVTYSWRDREMDKQQGVQIGLIAQDVQEVFPKLVTHFEKNVITLPDGKKEDVTAPLTLNYNGLIVPLVKAVKGLYEKWFADHEDVAAVKADLAKVKSENAAMKAYLCANHAEAPFCR